MPAACRARACAAALAAAVAIAPGALLGARPVPVCVVVARPWNADPITAEALARVSGELVAAGFDVHIIPVPADADPRGTVETVGRELGPAAAFAIFPGVPATDGTPSAEIWVADRLTGRASVDRLSVDPRSADRGAAVLAVRAVELLKAGVAEIWVPEAAVAPPPQEIQRAPAPAPVPPEAPPRIGVEAAVAVIGHVGGFPADVGPALKVAIHIRSGWTARIGAFGLGRPLELTTMNGTATVHQQLATVDLLAIFRAGRRLTPFVAASAGLFHLDVSSSGNAPWIGRSTSIWDGLAGAGVGASLALGKHAAVIAEVRALFFWHRPLVLVGDAEGGEGGLPAIVATVGVGISP